MFKENFKIKDVLPAKEYLKLPFGRQLEYAGKIKQFKDSAKRCFVSIKHRSFSKAWKEFVDLHKPVEYYYRYRHDANGKDDSVEIFYK